MRRVDGRQSSLWVSYHSPSHTLMVGVVVVRSSPFEARPSSTFSFFATPSRVAAYTVFRRRRPSSPRPRSTRACQRPSGRSEILPSPRPRRRLFAVTITHALSWLSLQWADSLIARAVFGQRPLRASLRRLALALRE